MYIKQDFDFKDLKNECWSGAIETLKIVEENGKEQELINLLCDEFMDVPTLTEVNDFLWFENSTIFSLLEIEEEEED